MTRYDIINEFIYRRNYRYFLEIGTSKGDTYKNIIATVRISVDPDPETMATYRITSDEFFRHCQINQSFEGNMTFDIIFIDGLHEHDQAYRDICNAMSVLNPGGVIIIHDCLPTTEHMQIHADRYMGGEWTGDVWKAFVRFRKESIYRTYTIDTDYGCGIIDTSAKATADTSALPHDMETMTYSDFVRHRNDWLNVKERIQYGK